MDIKEVLHEWSRKELTSLIYAIKNKKCILMLGPDASLEEENGTLLPLTKILTKRLLGEINRDLGAQIDTSNLAQVSQYYIKAKKNNTLLAEVARFFKEKEGLTSDLYRDLAVLPFYLTITTTLDNMFLEALKRESKNPGVGWYNFRTPPQKNVEIKDSDNPLVFYLYGNIEEEKSLLLAESDFLNFLVDMMSRDNPIQENILNELHDKGKFFLFLGFGFRQWHLRILMHVLKVCQKESCSFALEHYESENISKLQLQETVFFFNNNDYNIHILKTDIHEFVRELRLEFEKTSNKPGKFENEEMEQEVFVCHAGENTNKSREFESEEIGPEIFICHAGENKEYAAKLNRKLKDKGFRPWYDKKLHGGDEWDPFIRQKIDQVDYFVVLQSNALNKKIEGYVHLEIYHAMERQKKFKHGFSFIIPARIDECELMKNLSAYHSVDLFPQDNIEPLIEAIQRDFAKRNNL